ncbi:MAG TPA: MauE/DoxX family redox-associated membrane protein [Acidimicrobiales bacterium]
MATLAAGALGAAALLLVVAGAAKVADPSRTAGALRALGWPSSPWLVRAAAAAELLLGLVVLVVGGRVPALLVAASYLGFALFVMAALRSGTPVGTCGCFARDDTPPSPAHVALDAVLAAGAVLAGALDAPALLDASWAAWLVAGVLGGWSLAAFTAPWAGRTGGDERARRAAGRVPPEA